MEAEVQSKPSRKVDRNHLAFYRGHLQGLDLKDAAARYLGEETDLREAKTALGWIREELVRAARRHRRLDYARLLRIRIAQGAGLASANTGMPTIEDFRLERDPTGFYSEAELLELYREEYPEAFAPNLKEKRRQRLLARQLEAILWAENYLATAPLPSDSVAEWFDTPKAVAFILSGIRSLADLLRVIESHGFRWWAGIRGIGQIHGRRIVRWLASHEATLGKIQAHALVPLRQVGSSSLIRPRETGILPLESFLMPEAFDGSAGENRHPGRCRIEAGNDHEAILAWLKAKATNPNTERAYRREAERLLLWAVLEKARPMSSLSVDDMAEYRDWLASLGQAGAQAWNWSVPQSAWLGKRNIPRWSKDWRPFDGALSHRSQAQAYTILKSMFEWMARMRYLDSNPLEGVARPRLAAGAAMSQDVELTRALTRAQWAHVIEYLQGLPLDARTARLRFVLLFAYATGLRLSELVGARTSHLYSVELRSRLGVRWMLKVIGKGGKARAVPMPSAVMLALRGYLAHRELGLQSDAPLVGRLGGEGAGIDPTTLYKALREFFMEVARDLRERGHEEDAIKLEKATTHWLRHTRGAHSAETMPINMVQRLLGHVSLSTTTIYTSADEESLYLELEKNVGEFALGGLNGLADENKNNVATLQHEEKEKTSNLCGAHP